MSFFNQVTLFDPQTPGKTQNIAPTGAAITSEPTRLVGPSFHTVLASNASDNFWTTARGTAATATTAESLGTLTGGTTNADWCSIISTKKARFLFVCANRFRSVARVSAVSAANTTTYIGALVLANGAPQDGFGFAIDGSGVVSVRAYTATSATLNVSSGFNGELGSTYTIPDTNFHSFDVVYYYAAAYYYIDQKLLHYAAPTTTQFSVEMDLPIGLSVVNGTSPTSRVVQILSSSILRYGKPLSTPIWKYFATADAGTILKTGSGTLHRVIIGQPINAATISIYDAVSATNPMVTLTTGSATAVPTAIELNLEFQVGLFIVTVGVNAQTTFVFD